MLNYQKQIALLLTEQLQNVDKNTILSLIEIPPKDDMGDYAFPCFKLAKVLRKSPKLIAEELAKNIELRPFLQRVSAEGPYVNFYINNSHFAKNVLETIFEAGTDYAKLSNNNKTVVIDYSSPNIAKPFHVGHLRSTILGQSLYNIYTHLGYDCIGVNHLGDWGTQFGKQILAYKLWGNDEVIKKDPIKEFVKLYVKFHDEADKNPKLVDEARAWLKKLEEGDEEAIAIWKWTGEESLKEFNMFYKKLGVKFDYNTGESFYIDKVPAVIAELQQKNLLTTSEGAQVVELGEDIPPCLIMKADGTTIYASRDIAAVLYRKKTFDFDKVIYLTDYSQNLHFKQWIKVVELMGYDFAKDIVHASFGRVSLASGRMQTRKGNVILLEQLLNEALTKTNQVIEERNPDLPNKEKVAEQVAVGSIIFNDLYNNRISDIVFNWDEVLNFEGETGPYLQYAYARSCRVLEKCNVEISTDINYELLNDVESINLLKSIYKFPQEILKAAEEYEPSLIGRQVMRIARNFSKFYNTNHILTEDQELCKARALLCFAANTAIKVGLNLLNMPAPTRM